LHDLAQIGVGALARAVKEAEVICCDEVGTMELYSPGFKAAVKKVLNSGKPLLGTIHYKAADPLVNFIKSRKDIEIIEVILANRCTLQEAIVNRIINQLKLTYSHNRQ